MSSKNEVNVVEQIKTLNAEPLTDIKIAEPEQNKEEISETEPDNLSNSNNSKKIDTSNQVVTWFSACGRCSFFLTGYQIENGSYELEAATSNGNSGWLNLTWNPSMCKLVCKSYGSRLDIDCYHFDGSCPECHREFVYDASDENGQLGRFRIELKPRSGRKD